MTHVAAGGAAPTVLALRHELARKALHLTAAAAPVAYALGLPRRTLLVVLCVMGAVAVGVELARRRAPLARDLFHRAAGPLLRQHEHEGLSGATWMLASFIGVVALAPRAPAIAAMWAVAVGDASAAVVGRSLARRRELIAAARGRPLPPSPGRRKSLAGSAACLVATLVGALWLAGLGPVPSVVAAVAAAVAEWPRMRLDDNVRVAAAVAGAVMLTSFLLAP